MKAREASEFIEMVEKEKTKGIIATTVPQFKIDNFANIVEIGDGGEGRVYIANSNQFGHVAIKILKQKILLKGNSQEIELLAKIRHPHVVQLFGIIFDEYNSTTGFVMEYMKMGSLYKVIHSSAINYEMGQIYSWISQASLGLQYLHEHSLLHRDIKPQNMLLGFSIDHLKLADFGLARETTVTSITGGIGTVLYMAPEVIQATSYAAPADVYSLTISIWEMIHRRRPFDEEQETSNFKIAADVRNGRRPLVDPLLVDTEMETLLQKGWHENPDKRISVTEITVFSRAKLGPNSSVDHAASIVETTSGSSLQPRSQKSALLISNYSENNTITREKRRAKDSLRAAGILLILMAFGIGVWMTVTKLQIRSEKFDNIREQSEEVLEKKILVMGGRNDGDKNDMFLFDISSSEWTTLSLKLPCNDSYGSAFYLKNDLYVLASNDSAARKRLYILKTAEMKWIQLAETNEPRDSLHSNSLIFQGCIWIFGDWSGQKILRGVEKYCPGTNKWIQTTPLKTARRAAAVAAHKGNIIISGGRGHKDSNDSLKSVESFNPKTKKWSSLPDMPASRIHHSMVSFNGSLIVLGGFLGRYVAFNTVWNLNLEENNATWKELPVMQEPHQAHSAVLLDNEIFVIGGDSDGAQKTVEIFDGTTWQYGPDLPSARFAALAVVIPNQLAEILTAYRNPDHKEETIENVNQREEQPVKVSENSLKPAEAIQLTDSEQRKETILVMGGRNDGDKDEMAVMEMTSFQWRTLSLKLPHNISYACSVYLNGKIYIFGGYGLWRKTYTLDIDGMKWIELAEMNDARSEIQNSCLIFQGCIWVFGGWTGEGALRSVEKYCPETNKWIRMGVMLNVRNVPAAALHGGNIFVSGGIEQNGVFLRKTETFNATFKTWSSFLDMPAPRGCHSMISFGDNLLILGGKEEKSNHKAFNTVWSLNSKENNATWKKQPSMQEPRESHSVVLLNKEIYVIGGDDSLTATKTVEVFNGEAWRYGPDLPYERWGATATVIPLRLANILANNTIQDGKVKPIEKLHQIEEQPSEAVEKTLEQLSEPSNATTEETILLMGGRNSVETDEMMILDRNTSQWTVLQLTLPRTAAYGSSFYVNNNIYVFGNEGWGQKLYKLDFAQMKWIEMAEMNERRDTATNSALIFQGCIWTFGGWNGWKVLKSVEKYCPEMNRWIRMPIMPTARQAAAAALHNGKMVISGGRGPTSSSDPLSSVESFDPITGAWSSLPDMPAPRVHHSMVSYKGSLIVTGGYKDRFIGTNTVWTLNLKESNVIWKELPSIQEARQAHSVVLLDNKLFVIGGQNEDAIKSVEVFDGKTWRFDTDLPEGGWGMLQAVIPIHLTDSLLKYRPPEMILEPADRLEIQSSGNQTDQTILVIGGRNGQQDLDEIVVFDANLSQWRTVSLKLPNTLAYGGSAYLNGEIYIFGGDGQRKKSYKLNNGEMRWVELAEMHESRQNVMSSSLIFEECIWVLGGWNDTSSLETAEKYCPETNTWSLVPNMPTRHSSSAAAVHNGGIIVSGGFGIASPLASVESFNSTSETWSSLVDLPIPRACHSMISAGGSLIVFGGYKKQFKALNTVWSLKTEEKNSFWKRLPSMQERRHSLSVVILNEEIFVIGGAVDLKASRTVEIFDGKTWRFAPKLPSGRWGMSSVIIPNQLADLLLKYSNKET